MASDLFGVLTDAGHGFSSKWRTPADNTVTTGLFGYCLHIIPCAVRSLHKHAQSCSNAESSAVQSCTHACKAIQPWSMLQGPVLQ